MFWAPVSNNILKNNELIIPITHDGSLYYNICKIKKNRDSFLVWASLACVHRLILALCLGITPSVSGGLPKKPLIKFSLATCKARLLLLTIYDFYWQTDLKVRVHLVYTEQFIISRLLIKYISLGTLEMIY